MFRVTGNSKDKAFAADRRYHLERFIRKLAKLDFLINGEECQVFFRHEQELEVGVSILKLTVAGTTMSAHEKYLRIVRATGIVETEHSQIEKAQFESAIIDFSNYAKKVEPLLK